MAKKNNTDEIKLDLDHFLSDFEKMLIKSRSSDVIERGSSPIIAKKIGKATKDAAKVNSGSLFDELSMVANDKNLIAEIFKAAPRSSGHKPKASNVAEALKIAYENDPYVSQDLQNAVKEVKQRFEDAFTNYAKSVTSDIETAFVNNYKGKITKLFSNDIVPDVVAKEIQTLIGRTFASNIKAQDWLNKAVTPVYSGQQATLKTGSIIQPAKNNAKTLYYNGYKNQVPIQNTNINNDSIKGKSVGVNMKVGTSWANKGTAGYTTIKTASNAMKQNANRGYFDFETVGDIGGKNFSITEMSLRSGQKDSMLYFELTKKAAESIRATIENIKHGERVTENALRSAYRMLDYSMDDMGHIVSTHSTLDPTKDWIDPKSKNGQKILDRMENGLKIMTGKAGAKNLTAFNTADASWTQHGAAIKKAFEGVFGNNIFNQGQNVILGSNNGIKFDYPILFKALSAAGLKREQLGNISQLDLTDLMRSLVPIGSKNATTGAMLKNYTLSGMADFFLQAQHSGAHAASADTEIGQQIMDKILETYRMQIQDFDKKKIVNRDLKGKIIKAKNSYTRQSEYGFLTDVSGKKLPGTTGDVFDYNDIPIQAGQYYQILDRTLGKAGSAYENLIFTKIKNILTGDVFTEAQTQEQFEQMINTMIDGETSRISKNFNPTQDDIQSMVKLAASTPFAYDTFAKMLLGKKNKNGTYSLSAKNKSAMLTKMKDDDYKKLQKTVKDLSEEEGLTDVDRSRILNLMYGSRTFQIGQDIGLTNNTVKNRSRAIEYLIERMKNNDIDENALRAMGWEKENGETDFEGFLEQFQNDDPTSPNSWAYNLGRIIDSVVKDEYKQKRVNDQKITEYKTAVDKVRSSTASFKGKESTLLSQLYNSGKFSEQQKKILSGSEKVKELNGIYNFKHNSYLGALQEILKQAGSQGVGTALHYDEKTGGFTLGLYNSNATNPEYLDENGELALDWGQMARIELPSILSDNAGGSGKEYHYRGMVHGGLGIRHLNGGKVETVSAPEYALRALQAMFKKSNNKDSFVQRMISQNRLDTLEAVLGGKMAESIDFSPALGDVGVARSLLNYEKSGGSIEQKVFRNNLFYDELLYEDILKLSEAGQELLKSGDDWNINNAKTALSMAQHIYNIGGEQAFNEFMQHPDNVLTPILNDEATLNQIRGVFKQTKAQGYDLGAVKEEARLKYINGGVVDPHHYDPLGFAYAPGDRTPSQHDNYKLLTEKAKEARKKALKDKLAFKQKIRTSEKTSLFGEDYYDNPEQYMFRVLHGTDQLGEYRGSIDNDSIIVSDKLKEMSNTVQDINKEMTIDDFKWIMANAKMFKGVGDIDKLFTDENGGVYKFGNKSGIKITNKNGLFKPDSQYPIFKEGDMLVSATLTEDGMVRLNAKRYDNMEATDRILYNTRGKGTRSALMKNISNQQGQEAMLVSEDIDVNARNLGGILTDKLNYLTTLIDENTIDDLEERAKQYDKLTERLKKLGIAEYEAIHEVDDQENRIDSYINRISVTSDPTKLAAGLKTMAAGFYLKEDGTLGDDWFASVAKDLGYADKYDPNMTAGRIGITNNPMNIKTEDAVKWGLKSEKSIDTIIGALGLKDDEAGAFKKYLTLGQGRDLDVSEEDEEGIKDALRYTMGQNRNDTQKKLRIVSKSKFESMDEEEKENVVSAEALVEGLIEKGDYGRIPRNTIQKIQQRLRDRMRDGYDGYYFDLDDELEQSAISPWTGLTETFKTDRIGLYGLDKDFGGHIPSWVMSQLEMLSSMSEMRGQHSAGRQEEMVKKTLSALHNAVGHKEGEVYQDLNESMLKMSTIGRAIAYGNDVYDGAREFLSNKIMVNDKQLEEILDNADLSTDNIRRELSRAQDHLKMQSKNGPLTRNQQQDEILGLDIDNITDRKELIKYLVQATSFKKYGENAYDLTATSSRVPFISRFGEHFTGFITGDAARGTFKMAPAYAGWNHGDFDGDTFRAAIAQMFLSDTDYENSKDIFNKAKQLTADAEQWFENIEGLNKPKGTTSEKPQPKSYEQLRKDIQAITDPKKKTAIATASTFNKKFVGQNSLLNTGIRNAIRKAYGDKAYNDPATALLTTLAELPSKFLEQDPISAKKIIESLALIDEGKDPGIMKTINAYNEISKARGSIDYTGSEEGRYDEFFGALERAGVMKKVGDESYLSGQSASEVVSWLLASMGLNPESHWKDGAFTEDARDIIKENVKQGLGFSDNTEEISTFINDLAEGKVSKSTLLRATRLVDRQIKKGNFGHGLYDVDKWTAYKDYYSLARPDSVLFNMGKMFSIKPEVTDLNRVEEQAKANKEINEAFEDLISRGPIDWDRGAYLKTPSANGGELLLPIKESKLSSPDRLDDKYYLTADGKSFAVTHSDNFDKDHKYIAGVKNGKGTQLSNYVTSTGFAGRAVNLMNDMDSTTSNVLKSLQNDESVVNYDTGAKTGAAKTLRGTMVHKLMELIPNLEGLKDIEDLTDPNKLTDEFKASDSYKEYNKAIKTYTSNIKKLGLGEAEEFNEATIAKMAEGLNAARQTFIGNQAKNGGRLFGSEVALGMHDSTGGKVVGTLDDIVLGDDGNWHILDSKTTKGAPGAKEALQMMTNQELFRSLLADIRAKKKVEAQDDTDTKILERNKDLKENIQKIYGFSEQQAKDLILHSGIGDNEPEISSHISWVDEKGNATVFDANKMGDSLIEAIQEQVQRGGKLTHDQIQVLQKNGFYKNMGATLMAAVGSSNLGSLLGLEEGIEIDPKVIKAYNTAVGELGAEIKDADNERLAAATPKLNDLLNQKTGIEAVDKYVKAQRYLEDAENFSDTEKETNALKIKEMQKQKRESLSAIDEMRNVVADAEKLDINSEVVQRYQQILGYLDEINAATETRKANSEYIVQMAKQDAELQEQIAAAEARGDKAGAQGLKERLTKLRDEFSKGLGKLGESGLDIGWVNSLLKMISGTQADEFGNISEDTSSTVALGIKQKGAAKGTIQGLTSENIDDKEYLAYKKEYLALQRKINDNEVKRDQLIRRSNDNGNTPEQAQGYAQELEAVAKINNLYLEQLSLLKSKRTLSKQQEEDLAREMQYLTLDKEAALAKNATYVPKQQRGFLGTIFNEFKASAAYLTKASLIYGAIGKVKQAVSSLIQTAEKLDKALTNLQIVTRSTREDLQEAIRGYNNLADQLGVATDTVLQSAEDWLRAGYSIEESNKLITSSIKLATLGMMDAKEATTALISVMKGWKVPEEQLASIVDNVTALDSAFATTAGDITTAMAKANVSASLSGMSIKDFEAYITTVLDTSQLSAETVGTSFKTLIARMGNVKSGKFTKNYDPEEMGDEGGYSSLNDTETVLNKIGIQTRDTASNFRNMNLILEDIAKKWHTLDNVTQNAVTTAMAGTRQRESLNVLFENWSSVDKAKNIIEKSEGTADAKYEQYLNSIEASRNEFQAAIQENITNNQFVINVEKQLIDVGTNLIKTINSIGTYLLMYIALAKGPQIVQGFRRLGLGNIYETMRGLGPGAALANWESAWQSRRDQLDEYKDMFPGDTRHDAAMRRHAMRLDKLHNKSVANYNQTVEQTAQSIMANPSKVGIYNLGSGNKRRLAANISADEVMSASRFIQGLSPELQSKFAGMNTEELRGVMRNVETLTKGGYSLIGNNGVAYTNDQFNELQRIIKDGAKPDAIKNWIRGSGDKNLGITDEGAVSRLTDSINSSIKNGPHINKVTAARRSLIKNGEFEATSKAMYDGMNTNAVYAAAHLLERGNIRGAGGAIPDVTSKDLPKGWQDISRVRSNFEKMYAERKKNLKSGKAFTYDKKTMRAYRQAVRLIYGEDNALGSDENLINDQNTEGIYDRLHNMPNSYKGALSKIKRAQKNLSKGIIGNGGVTAALREAAILLDGQDGDLAKLSNDELLNETNQQKIIERLKEGAAKQRTRTGTFLKKNAGTIAVGAQALSMAMQPIAQAISGKSMAESLQGSGLVGDKGSAVASTLTSMAPMIGSMFGLPGMIAGSAIGVFGPFLAMGLDALKTTADELREGFNKNQQALSQINESIDKINVLKDQENQLFEYVKGVNVQTGENIALSDEDFQSYQSILEQIANTVTGVYISTDAQGNKTLKQNGQIYDVAQGIQALIKHQNEETAAQAKKLNKDNKIESLVKDAQNVNASNVSGISGKKGAELANDKLKDFVKKFGEIVYDESKGVYAVKNEDGKTQYYRGDVSIDDIVKQTLNNLNTEEINNAIEVEQNKLYGGLGKSINAENEAYYGLDEVAKNFADNIFANIGTTISTFGGTVDYTELKNNSQTLIELLSDTNSAVAQSVVVLNSIDQNTADYGDRQTRLEAAKSGAAEYASKTGYKPKTDEYNHAYDLYMRQAGYVLQENYDSDGNKVQSGFKIEGVSGKKKTFSNIIYDTASKDKYMVIDGHKFAKVDGGWVDISSINKDDISTTSTHGTQTSLYVDGKQTVYTDDEIKKIKQQNIGNINDAPYVDPIVNTAAQVIAGTIVGKNKNTSKYRTQIDTLVNSLTGTDIQNAYKATDALNRQKGQWYDRENKKIDISKFLEIVDNVAYSPNQTVSNALATVQAMYKSKGGKASTTSEMLQYITTDFEYAEIKGSGAFKTLNRSAQTLGVTLDGNVDKISKFADYLSIIGDTDALGHTNKTMSQLQETMSTILQIGDDIAENGKISTENFITLLDKFPELTKFIDGTDEGMQKIKDWLGDGTSAVAKQMSSAILTVLDDSSERFEDQIQNISDETARDAARAYGNMTTFRTIDDLKGQHEGQKGYYDKLNGYTYNRYGRRDENKATDQGIWKSEVNQKNVSYVRDLATTFGIDTTKEDAMSQFKQVLQQRLIKAGEDAGTVMAMTLGQMLDKFKAITDDGVANAELRVDALKNQLAALRQAKQLAIQQQGEQWVSKTMSQTKQAFDNGTMSAEAYEAKLKELANSQYASKEQQRELNEAIEDSKTNRLDQQWKNATISAEEYRKGLSEIMSQNIKGSSDYESALDKYIQSYDTLIAKEEAELALMPEKIRTEEERAAKVQKYQNQIGLYEQKLIAMQAAERQNTQEYLDVERKIYDLKKKQLETEKELLEYRIQETEKTLDAYGTLADYAIKQLEDRKKIINDVYQKEIDALQEINNQREKQVELTKLQQSLDNAKKEKSRVYVAGLGFTYRSDKTKIKEAKQNLQSNISKRQIEDLSNAQKLTNKKFDEEIKIFQGVKSELENIKTTGNASTALQQLIYNGVIPAGTTLDKAIKQIQKDVTKDAYGNVNAIKGKIDTLKIPYNNDKTALATYNSTIDDKLNQIMNGAGINIKDPGIAASISSVAAAISGLPESLGTIISTAFNIKIDDLEAQIKQAEEQLNIAQWKLITTTNTLQNQLNTYNKLSSFNQKTSSTKGNNVYTGRSADLNGVTLYEYQSQKTKKRYWTLTKGNKYQAVSQGSVYFDTHDLEVLYGELSGINATKTLPFKFYSSGIENGPVTRTGLAMLHGSSSSPEYVLNSDQAYTLLKNLSTIALTPYNNPSVTSYNNSGGDTTSYTFSGDINLPNVERPDQFFSELLRTANAQFGVNKKQI